MNLMNCDLDIQYTIVHIIGDDTVKNRLETLGCCVNDHVQVISRNKSLVIIKIKNISLGIDSSLAKKILVR